MHEWTTPNSPDEWLALAKKYQRDAELLLKNKHWSSAWGASGYAMECLLKAAIMKKERMNRWPDRDGNEELYSHDHRTLLKRLGVTEDGLGKSAIRAKLKTLFGWQRAHGYDPSALPKHYAHQMFEACFGSDGVSEWLADRYKLNA